ncbi:MAG TPA: sensor domain-containing diguanylate cyclase [Mycobacteriales bacterium]|nr:sensor domain-containing diguanylate cyclase [Mycobacteriales bacterium]
MTQVEDRLRAELTVARAIIDVQQQIAQAQREPERVMHVVATASQELTGAAGTVVEIVQGDDMVYAAATGIAEPHLGTRLRREGSLSGLCVEAGTPLICEDSETDERVDRDACRRIGLRSMAVVPLMDGDRCQGVLKVMDAEPGRFVPEDTVALQAMAGFIALSLQLADNYVAQTHKATTDALTGVANRDEFEHRLDGLLRGSSRRSVTVCFIDLDGFKLLNDTAGHAAGDEALRGAAAALTQIVREGDVVARIGGDEFVVACHGLRPAMAAVLVERIEEGIMLATAGRLRGASVGVAVSQPGDTVKSLLDRADAAMYEVKRERHRARETSAT